MRFYLLDSMPGVGLPILLLITLRFSWLNSRLGGKFVQENCEGKDGCWEIEGEGENQTSESGSKNYC